MQGDERTNAAFTVTQELKRLYNTKIKPLEERFMFNSFYSPCWTDAEFDARPQVLLVGQYSVGKTSFIRYLVGSDFPGAHIGPEPTTDKFMAIMYGAEERVIPGNALAVSADHPYRGLDMFGVSFLNKFAGSTTPSPILKGLTFVDTPGVLSGEKQRIARGYDFPKVCQWFADRADLILLLFDAHKLDISDELRDVILALVSNGEKLRCVLNKADSVSMQELLRVYGALLWSLGKVMQTPEVPKVYLGSFWNNPPSILPSQRGGVVDVALLEREEEDLMKELRDLPLHTLMKRINELVKRVRFLKVHMYLISHLRNEMPMLFGRESKQQQILDNMGETFRTVMRSFNLPPGDFPNMAVFCSKLVDLNWSKFPTLNMTTVAELDAVMSRDFPRLMNALPSLTSQMNAGYTMELNEAAGVSNINTTTTTNAVPVTSQGQGGYPYSVPTAVSVPVQQQQPIQSSLLPLFDAVSSGENKISGTALRPILMESGLNNDVLKAIWELVDVDRDGLLNRKEYEVMGRLMQMAKNGEMLPDHVPGEWFG